MAHSNGKITAPVSFADVNAVLGTSHTDLGWLCEENVNPWSKCKPVEPNQGTPVMQPLKLPNQGVTDNYTFKTIEGNWGLIVTDQNGDVINSALTLDEIQSRWGDGGDSYIYIKSLIEHTSWRHKKPYSAYRLTDFANYDNKAVPFMYDNYDGQKIVRYTNNSVYAETFYFWLANNSYSLNINDFSSYVVGGTTIGDMYLCAVYDGDSQGEIFSDHPLKYYSAGDSVDILIDDFTVDSEYDIYICLATKNDFYDDCRFFPLPNVQGLHTHLVFEATWRNIFADLKLVGIGATNVEQGLNIDLRNITYRDPSYYDAYGDGNILNAPAGKGVILKLTGNIGPSAISVSPYLFKLALNSGIGVNAAAQIVGPNSNCQDAPSTSQSTFSMVANGSYTYYIIATSPVADAVNEIQLSMTVSGHVQEGMQAATPWMNVHAV